MDQTLVDFDTDVPVEYQNPSFADNTMLGAGARWLGNDDDHNDRMPASTYIVPTMRLCKRWWPLSLVAMHLYCAGYCYWVLQEGPVIMTRLGPALIEGSTGSHAADAADDGQRIVPPVVAAVHVFTSMCFTPLNLMMYGLVHEVDSLLRDTGPPGWKFDTVWTFGKDDKTLHAGAVFGVFYSAASNLNPWADWHSREEQIMWVFLYFNTVFMFLATPPAVATFMRVLAFVDEMSDELDASLDNDTSDSVQVVIQCRANVLSRTFALTERCKLLINGTVMATLWAWSTASIAIFQDHAMIPVFLWFTVILALLLWELSRVNNRYLLFTRRFHELSKPSVRELEAAYTYLKQRELQLIVLGIPITRTVFARFLGSACVPLLASAGTEQIKNFASAGYF